MAFKMEQWTWCGPTLQEGTSHGILRDIPTDWPSPAALRNLQVVSERPFVKSGTQFSGQPQTRVATTAAVRWNTASFVIGCLLQTQDACVRYCFGNLAFYVWGSKMLGEWE